jgi:hypothetical protein
VGAHALRVLCASCALSVRMLCCLHIVHVLRALVTWQTAQASDGATRAVENVAVLFCGAPRGAGPLRAAVLAAV